MKRLRNTMAKGSLRKGLRWTVRGIVGIAVVAILGVLGYYLFRQFKYWTFARGYDDALARAKKAGLPQTAAEVDPRVAPPVDQNAAPLLVEANFKRKSDAKGPVNDYDPWKSASHLALCRETLARQKSELLVAKEIASKRFFYVHRDWDLGADVMLPEFAWIRQSGKLLAAQAYLNALDGQEGEALQALRSTRHISELGGQEPTLMPWLVSIAVEGLFLTSAERVLPIKADNILFLRKLRTIVDGSVPRVTITDWMRCEFYSCLVYARSCPPLRVFDLTEPEMISGQPELQPMPAGKPSGWKACAYCAFTMDAWADIVSTAESSSSDYRRFMRDAVTAQGRHESDLNKLPSGVFLLPWFAQAPEASFRVEARRLALLGLIDALVFRCEHHRFPESLMEAGFSATDPFGTGGFGYKKGQDSCVVYSVGINGKDDGGVNRWDDPKIDPSKDDVTARFPLLPASTGLEKTNRPGSP